MSGRHLYGGQRQIARLVRRTYATLIVYLVFDATEQQAYAQHEALTSQVREVWKSCWGRPVQRRHVRLLKRLPEAACRADSRGRGTTAAARLDPARLPPSTTAFAGREGRLHLLGKGAAGLLLLCTGKLLQPTAASPSAAHR